MEYVWGIYDFTPEHDDEIDFLAGERILVIEKDELYQDGWWKGTNAAGKTGLFPQRYTTTQPPAPPAPPRGHPIPTVLDPKVVGGPLDSLPEETDSLSGVRIGASETSGPQGTVMRATMTDIQEAIEQLGVHQDVDGASRSFSFSSTKDSLATDDGEDADNDGHHDVDEHSFATGGNWHKDARKLLARNATLQNHKRRSDSPLHRPPIEVEMSDESDDDRESPLQKRLGSPAPPQDISDPHPRDSLADPEPASTPRPEISTVPFVIASQILENGHTRHDSDVTIARPILRPASDSEIIIKPSSPNPAPKVSSPLAPTFVSAHLSPSSANIPLSPALTTFPTPPSTIPAPTPSVPQSPDPGEATVALQTAQPPPQRPSFNFKSIHPNEWSIEQVVSWLRNKGFDDDVCKKFTEHEISGDVLLELDLNMLKELDITAFGKRMRIANAISELRRPASVGSSSPSARFVGQSSYASRNVDGSNSAPQSVRGPSNMYSPESISPSLDISGTPMTDKFSSFTTGVSERLEELPEGSEAMGQGASKNATSEARNGRSRPLSLALSPSSDTSSKVFRSSQQLNGSTNLTPGIREEAGAFSDGETVSLRARFSKSRKGFGRSAGSASSVISTSDTKRSSSKTGAVTPSSSLNSGGLIHLSKKPSLGADPSPKPRLNGDSVKKDSAETRHSFFGGTLSKSRKPAPRYSESSHDTSSTGDKPTRGFSRLYLSRPRTSQGSITPSGSFERRKRTVSGLQETGRTLSEAPPLHPPFAEEAPTVQPDRNVLQQIGEPDLDGWLRKKGVRYNTWKLRYFVLKGPHLYYLRSKTESKLKGYINIKGYRIIADENANPGRYGFRIVHDTGGTHYFSSEEQLTVREWMKALMKATIGRDYSRPVVSSCNIPTIPLSVAQAMSPAPRPPSPTARDATQRALRRENPNQLSTRDARVLMGLPSENGITSRDLSGASVRDPATSGMIHTAHAASAPVRPSRESRGLPISSSIVAAENAQDMELIEWVNGRIPNASLKATNLSTSLANGLVLYRLAESIKATPDGASEVPDSVFPSSPTDDKLDGLFILFDFLLDNDVRMGNVSINDVRQGNREKLVQLVQSLKAWEEQRLSLE